jgi:hypothetical protein
VDFLVWTLRLPTQVEKAVRDLQRSLFRAHGLLAPLPVLVPLLCLRAQRAQRAPRAPDAATPVRIAPAARLHGDGFTQAGGCLLWRLRPADSLAGLARTCRALSPEGCAPLRPPPLPCAKGVVVGFLTEACSPEIAAPATGPLAGEEFPGLALSLLRVSSLGGEDPWWAAVSWVELRRLPLRRLPLRRGSP